LADRGCEAGLGKERHEVIVSSWVELSWEQRESLVSQVTESDLGALTQVVPPGQGSVKRLDSQWVPLEPRSGDGSTQDPEIDSSFTQVPQHVGGIVTGLEPDFCIGP
jgi:hypothetical protein